MFIHGLGIDKQTIAIEIGQGTGQGYHQIAFGIRSAMRQETIFPAIVRRMTTRIVLRQQDIVGQEALIFQFQGSQKALRGQWLVLVVVVVAVVSMHATMTRHAVRIEDQGSRWWWWWW